MERGGTGVLGNGFLTREGQFFLMFLVICFTVLSFFD